MRRHLGVEPEDAPKLPWWKRKMYVEGLLWEFADQDETEQLDGSPESLASQGFTVGTAT